MNSNSQLSSNRISRTAVKPQSNPSTISGTGSSLLVYLILLLLAVFIIILLLFLVQYLRQPCGSSGKMDYWSYLSQMDPTGSACNPSLPEKEFEEREIKQEEEVFHVSDQIYTFPEAYEKCKAYGAELASYQQLVDYYNKGGQFTSYGWSKGQQAFYPIQPCNYVKLRRRGINVGPPGVNGGKFRPHLRFGANCFGVKPEGKKVCKKPPICEEDGESLICRRNPEACKVLDSDRISGFNPKKWSQWGEKDSSCE